MLRSLSWTELRKLIDGISKTLPYQFEESASRYVITAYDGPLSYDTTIFMATKAPHKPTQAQHDTDRSDFETNFKASANTTLDPLSNDARRIVRADSRPDGTATCFTSRGDSATEIGGGKEMAWDFSDTADEVTALTFDGEPIPTDYKRKRIDVTFNDEVWLKEGTRYFFNAPKGQFVSFYLVCPPGSYYKDENGTIPASALGKKGQDMYSASGTNEVVVAHYVQHLGMQGDAPIGDELNTESATEDPVPAGYILRYEITTPDTDELSNGYINMELYRKRSILMPGEAL